MGAKRAAAPGGVKGVMRRLDAFSQRHRAISFPFAVIKKFGEDKAGYLAALIAYYGFFSLFPLLLVFVTVLGYVLAGDPGLRQDIVDSTLAQFPVIGDDSVNALEGNLFALIFGSLTALWAGMGALQAMEHAMNTVWGVPMRERPNFLLSRLRAIMMLGVFGGGIIGVTILGAWSTATAGLGPWTTALTALLALVFGVGMYLLAFKVLTHCDLPWRAHFPGAVLGGALFVALQVVGGYYVNHVIKGAEDTYGVFATVIGLLSWMYLQAQIAVFSAEVNVVWHSHLWPRSLPGGTLTEADRRSLQEHAAIEERVEDETAKASFDGGSAPQPAVPEHAAEEQPERV